jgi:hypothetical protein
VAFLCVQRARSLKLRSRRNLRNWDCLGDFGHQMIGRFGHLGMVRLMCRYGDIVTDIIALVQDAEGPSDLIKKGRCGVAKMSRRAEIFGFICSYNGLVN